MNEHVEPVKSFVDALSIGTVVATISGLLPAIAALLSIIWTAIRIWETKTVQRLRARLLPSSEASSGQSNGPTN